MSSDEELVRQSRRGDRVAFQTLVEKYQKRVYAVAYGLLGNREDALDAAQEAFVKAHRSLGRFKGKSSFYTWLYRITVNAAIDLGRKRAQRDEIEFREELEPDEEKGRYPVAPASENPADRLMRKELGEVIEDAIGKLPPDQRTAVMLREIEGLSYKEIADVFMCSLGRVKSRLHEARQKLNAALEAKTELWID